MPLGPVFHAELLTTARRARYYILRVIYGLLLLLILWSGYRNVSRFVEYRGGDELTISEMTSFSQQTFLGFTSLQMLVILLLTPALVAPVIASEKSGKTFHYLLVSDLSSAEIVLGKLGARILLLLVILAVGLPVFSLLFLLGGITPGMIAERYAMLGALLLFMAGLSILVSVLTSRPRRAIFYAYATPVAIVLAPWVLWLLLFRFQNYTESMFKVLAWAWPLPRPESGGWSMPLNPGGGYGIEPEAVWIETVRLDVVWALYGVAGIVAATRLLRPIGRRSERQWGVELRIDKDGRPRWRMIPRPPCGDEPMLWKELYTSRASGAVKLLGMGINLFVGVLIGLLAIYTLVDAATEISREGFFSPSDQGVVRRQVAQSVGGLSALIVGLWMLGTASTAASSITSEREGDFWISLLSTPLTAGQIVRAKMLGAVARFRWVGLSLVVLWILAAAIGALHPIGVVLGLVELAAFIGFAAALGVAISLASTTTTRALALTLGLMVFLNLVFLVLGGLIFDVPNPLLLAGSAPLVLRASLVSYPDLNGRWLSAFYDAGYSYRPIFSQMLPDLWPGILAGLAIYGFGALLIAGGAIARFDAREDRPAASEDDASDLPASEQRKRLAL